jgi:hypothetical protein
MGDSMWHHNKFEQAHHSNGSADGQVVGHPSEYSRLPDMYLSAVCIYTSTQRNKYPRLVHHTYPPTFTITSTAPAGAADTGSAAYTLIVAYIT